MDAPDATAAAREVRRRWRAREAPDGDFVMFGDGSLRVMDLLRLRSPGQVEEPQAEHWQWIELLRATEWSAVNWVDVDAVLASHAHAGSRAVAGESAAHGSIGYVALTRDDDEDDLEWVAISRWSNPFCGVTVDETSVTAVSTAGRIWTFSRNAPQQVVITEDPDNPWRL
ncbi:hypothetical protein [Streptomyces winkii]|uniref:hypothetical protein n=1 Tax=Streptomyces winkii TaxID=3051178 RepID=UPI0028D061E8|nr:hypothetical protein [Streptomyces sp. DSM 40971]